MNKPPDILLLEHRGEVVESIVRGHVCVLDSEKKIIYSAGDPHYITHYRSASKPFQAIPLLERGLDKKYDLTKRELAIFCASHWAERFHVETLEGIMRKTGFTPDDIIAPACYPYSKKAGKELILKGTPKSPLYHNCSGKHLGMLLLCRELGEDIKNYWKYESATQKLIKSAVAEVSEYEEHDILAGIDGCGVPVYGMPIFNMAAAFLKFADSGQAISETTGGILERLGEAMNENPEMIAGAGSLCEVLNSDTNIVAKSGAKGLYCLALRSEKLAFALKIECGAMEFLPYAVISVLEHLKYGNNGTLDKLKAAFPSEFKSPTGEIAYRITSQT